MTDYDETLIADGISPVHRVIQRCDLSLRSVAQDELGHFTSGHAGTGPPATLNQDQTPAGCQQLQPPGQRPIRVLHGPKDVPGQNDIE